MSNFTASRLGQANGAGSATALFLSVFGGEVMTAFTETNVMMPLHTVRTIEHGTSARFPATAKATAAYHTAGTELAGAAINHNERVISIDNLLTSHVFVANIDEAMNHWDVRGNYSSLLGRALALEFDKRALQQAVLAARASATVTGGNAGNSVTSANALTVGADLAAAIFSAAQAFDEDDVPSEDRVVIMKPAQYYLLGQTTVTLDKDWGGSGSYSQGRVGDIAGIRVIKSNNLAIGTNVAAVTGENNTYAVNLTNTVAIAMHKAAIGTVKLIDLATESEYSARHQGTLLVAKYALGTGILRPECACEIKTA